MKYIVKVFVILMVFLLAPQFYSTTKAEGDSISCPRVKLAVELTGKILKLSGNWLQDCEAGKADTIFHRARHLQYLALEALRHQNCETALRLTLESRKTSYRAVVFCFGVEGLCQRTQAVVMRTGQAIDYLKDLIERCDNERAKHLFRAAVYLQQKAVEAQRQNMCPGALELTLKARGLLLRAAYICHEDARVLGLFPDLEETEVEEDFGSFEPAIAGIIMQNSPNPFNAQTAISYTLPSDAKVTLVVYNIKGEKVKTLVDEFQTAGAKRVIWDGTNQNSDKVASGVYFYRLEAGDLKATKRMVLLK